MSDDENQREDYARAGTVTHEEAYQILGRFNASHWFRCLPPRFEDFTIDKEKAVQLILDRVGSGWDKDGNGREVARYSIPARPEHDDDIRLSAYIACNKRIEAAAREVLRRAKANWGEDLPPEFRALSDVCGAP